MSIMLIFEKPPGKPILRGNAHYWSVIRELDEAGPWTIHEIDMRSRTKARGTVADFVKRLVKGGIAEATGETRVHRNLPTPTYRLRSRPLAVPSLRADGTEARVGQGQSQMWTVLRGPLGRQGVTAADLMLYGSTDTVPVSEETAKTYLRRLFNAGYLLALPKASSREKAKWRLKPGMDTGRLAPMLLRASVVYDRNRNEAIGPVEAVEVSS